MVSRVVIAVETMEVPAKSSPRCKLLLKLQLWVELLVSHGTIFDMIVGIAMSKSSEPRQDLYLDSHLLRTREF